MLFEHRCYTLKLGCTQAFWDLQGQRGFPLVQPILDRLVGYFQTSAGPSDQIVHLYRFDSYDDWVQRLHGLYGVPALQPYFKGVRQIMTAQENRFLALAPLPELNPLWGQGRDWLPGQRGGVPRDLDLGVDAVVEETVTQLVPGALPLYWDAYARGDLRPGTVCTWHLLGCFYTLVGRFHQVVHYRCYADMEARQHHMDALRSAPEWQQFAEAIRPLVLAEERKLLQPSRFVELSPLFSRAA